MPTPARIARFDILRPLGMGGMGAVYLGFDPQLQRPVAVKVLRDDLDLDGSRERFLREARMAAGLRHPNIVIVYDFGVHDSSPYLAMEYIPGDTLAALIARGAVIALTRRLEIAEQMCAAIAHAHRMRMVHRDIKPENVLIDADGVVKVVDFGLARTAESTVTRKGLVMGTLSYMAPEQFLGASVDHRADIFALGAVLYELLSFRRAFGGESREHIIWRVLNAEPQPLEQLCPEIPHELYGVVRKALRKNPAERHDAVSLLQADLRRLRRALGTADDDVGLLGADRPFVVPTPDAGAANGGAVGAVIVVPNVASRPMSTSEFERATVVPAPAEAAIMAADTLPRVDVPLSQDVIPQPRRSRARNALAASLLASIGCVALVWAGLVRSNDDARDVAKRTETTARVEPGREARAANTPAPMNAPKVGSREPEARPPDRKTHPPAVASPRREERTTAPAASEPVTPRVEPVEPRAEPLPEATAPAAPAPPPVASTPLIGVTTPPGTPVARTLSDRATPAAPPPSDAALVRDVIDAYAAAMSARDIDRLGRVVRMDAPTRRRQEESFGAYEAFTMRLVVLGEPRIAGGAASVRCRAIESVTRRGRRVDRQSEIVITLEREDGRWSVVEVRGR
jgi:hypothetical protein